MYDCVYDVAKVTPFEVISKQKEDYFTSFKFF